MFIEERVPISYKSDINITICKDSAVLYSSFLYDILFVCITFLYFCGHNKKESADISHFGARYKYVGNIKLCHVCTKSDALFDYRTNLSARRLTDVKHTFRKQIFSPPEVRSSIDWNLYLVTLLNKNFSQKKCYELKYE